MQPRSATRTQHHQKGGLEDLFRAYVLDPRSFWQGPAVRQAEKLEMKRESVNHHMGWSNPDVASSCLAWAREREGRHPPTYITGLGGSGSHWLAGMLGELPMFFDVGEVYIPERLRAAMNANPDRAPLILDALHVLHTRQPAADDARAVNCAAGSHKAADYVRWDQGATVVRLLRDPRDQVLSTTFRKDEYRQWVAPDASDDDYLHHRCSISRSDETRYKRAGCAADLVIKYEDLRRKAVAELERLLQCAGVEVDHVEAEAASERHNAERIRAGQSDVQGNLYLYGPSLPWTDHPTSRVAAIHAELIDVIEAQAYSFGVCLLPPPRSEPRDLQSLSSDGLRIRGWAGKGWELGLVDSEAFLAEVSMPSISQVPLLRSAGVYGICAARIDSLSDDWLDAVLAIPSLRTLDLGSVPVTDNQLDMLMEAGSRLRALSLWRSCSPDAVDEARRLLPITTVVG